MQEIDSEVVNNQRRRRKRIGQIKSGIIMIIAGWIFLSMILIICLFFRLHQLDQKIESLSENYKAEEKQNEVINSIPDLEETEATETAVQNAETETYEPAVPMASGVEDEMNLAADGDIHKVYLTFEDGPSENTGKILDILKRYDVKATFFVVGKEDEESKALYQRIVKEGHTLGMHSYSNKYNVIYQSKEAFEEDFTKLRDYLYEVTGTEAVYYRFPGGSSNQISNVPMNLLIHYLNQEGAVYYDWNVSSGDAAANTYSIDEIVANVTEDVVKYKTSVVLLHDAEDKSNTVDALEPLIKALLEMGAELLPIDEDTSVIQYVKADTVE